MVRFSLEDDADIYLNSSLGPIFFVISYTFGSSPVRGRAKMIFYSFSWLLKMMWHKDGFASLGEGP